MVCKQQIKEKDMLKRKLFLFSAITVITLVVAGIAIYLFLQNPATNRSLLIYTNYQSPETITNWIVDTDSNETWEVGKGLAARRWSPSGKYLMFHTISPSPIEIWISNADGSNIQKIFDNRDYPDLEIKGFDWLSDDVIIVNVISKSENSGFVYLLNTNSLIFERHNVGNFNKVSPNRLWIQWTNQNKYHLFDLEKNLTPLSIFISDIYFFSPDGNQLAYICDRKDGSSSLCIANISINGISNEHKIASIEIPIQTSDIWWSQDGEYLGVQTYIREKNENRIRVIDSSNGKTVYNWAFPTQTTRNFWSPHNDKIIDWNGVLLDLKTGQVSNFFEQIHETTPSYIVDWRMIEVP